MRSTVEPRFTALRRPARHRRPGRPVGRRALLGAAGLGAAALLAGPAVLTEPPPRSPVRPPRPLRMRAEHVAWVTGPESPNRTAEAAGVYATDLGIMWDDGRGGVLVAYGDTFGRGWSGFGGEARLDAAPDEADWRSNVVARSSTRDLTGGLVLDEWLTDGPGHARQVIPRDRRPGVVEYTVIPTAGIAIGTRNYLAYMSVRSWLTPGHWHTNYAGIAYSDDLGRTWHKPESAQWPNLPDGAQGWQMCAFTRQAGYLYVFGTPCGRWGPVRLARVPEDRVLDLDAHEQWTGRGWARDQSRAAIVIPAPASELSVIFHAPTGRWLAAHYHGGLDAVVVHTAPAVMGPWSGPQMVADSQQWPALYGAYFHPISATASTPYFQMSQWGAYNTRLMRLHLDV